MSDGTPVYSDLDEIQETGRKSAADAPEVVGSQKQRENMANQIRRHNSGVFSAAPEVAAEAPAVLPDIDPGDVAQTYAENIDLRARAAAQEAALSETRDQLLDHLAYEGTVQTREDFMAAADVLLEAGGGDRMAALVGDWTQVDPQGSQAWVESREAYLTRQTAAAGAQAARTAQQQIEAECAKELNDFQAEHPETQAGGLMHEMVAQVLASDRDAFASPQAFRAGLERAYEAAAGVAHGLERTAKVAQMKDEMKTEMIRHDAMRHGAEARAAAIRSRPVFPQNAEQLAAEITQRATPTKAQRQARQRERDAALGEEMHDSIRNHNLGVFRRGR